MKINAGCVIGDNSVIYDNVVLYDNTILGKNCIINAGTVIGSDGFGYHTVGNEHHKNPHINIFFQDVFPISLTELTFDVTQPDLEYLEASVTFRYRKFKTERI